MEKLTGEYKTLFVLTALLVIAVSFYFIYVLPFAENRGIKEGYDLIKILPEDIYRLGISNEHGTFEIIRSFSAWKIISPLKAVADTYEINNIIAYFEELKVRGIISEKTTSSELLSYGLSPPNFILTLLKDENSKIVTLHLGDLTPDGMGVYAYLDDRKEIVILPMYLTILLDKNLYDLRDKSVFTVDLEKLNRVDVEFAKSRIILGRSAETGWVFEKPVYGTAADNKEVTKLLKMLKELRVIEFYDKRHIDPGAHGLDNPWARITLFEKNIIEPQTVSFGLLSGKNGIFARNDNTGKIFVLPIEVTRLFMEDIYPLKDKSVFNFSNEDIISFEINHQGERGDVGLERKDDDMWYIRRPLEYRADSNTVEDFFSNLRSIRIEKFLPYLITEENLYGFDNPLLEIVIENRSLQKNILTIGKLYADDPDLVYARLDNQDDVFLINQEIIKEVQKSWEYFRYRHLLQFGIGDVYRVDFVYQNVEASVQLLKEDKWQIVSHNKNPISSFSVLLLLRELWRLKSTSELSDDMVENLRQAEIRIVIWIEEDEPHAVYDFWNSGDLNSSYIVSVNGKHYTIENKHYALLDSHLSKVYAQIR